MNTRWTVGLVDGGSDGLHIVPIASVNVVNGKERLAIGVVKDEVDGS